MQNVKTVQGITEVYPSKEAKGFEQSTDYPIVWEFIYINDEGGKQFTSQLMEAINQLPQKRGYLMDLQGEATDLVRCAECAFNSKDALRKVLNESLAGMVIHDENQKGIKTKLQLLEEATKAINQELAVA